MPAEIRGQPHQPVAEPHDADHGHADTDQGVARAVAVDERQREPGQVGGDAFGGQVAASPIDPHMVDHLAAEADQRGADRVDGDVQGQDGGTVMARADQW